MLVFQVAQRPGPPVDTLAVLLSDFLLLPHPASCGNRSQQMRHPSPAHQCTQTAFFFLQIMIVAVIVSLWYQKRADFHSFSTKGQLELSNWAPPEARSRFSTDGSSYLDKVGDNSTF